MDILVTGSTGFVGRNLVEYLQESHILTGVNRSIDKRLKKNYQWDQLLNIPDEFDVFIHLAGKAHDLKNVSDANAYIDINFELTKRIFDRFTSSNAKYFIFLSSVKAVAESVDGILIENDQANPQTAYGKSKLMAENYILRHLPQEKKVFILRPCMIHGAGNKGNLNILYNVVNKGFPWPLAAFDNKRSFLSIDNLNYLISQLLENNKVPSGIYNCADDEAVSTNELIEVISSCEGKSAKLWKLSPRLINLFATFGNKLKLPFNSERLKKLTESYVVSNQKIKTALGIYKLPLTVKEGLEKTIRSFGKTVSQNR